MFKEKSTKKRLVATESKEISTLDARHQNMILQLQQGQQTKKNLEETKETILNQLNYWKSIIEQLYLENNIQSKDYEIAWSSNIYYKDQLRLLNYQCKKIMDESKEIEYYENTGAILFDYYNLLENQTSIISNKVQEELFPKQTKGRKKFLPPNQKNILQAFNLEPESPPESICSLSGEEQKDKVSLVDDYLLHIDPNYIKPNNNLAIGNCTKCDIPLVCLLQEGMMICPDCGYQELLLVEQNRPIYRQSSKEASHQSYKRINHFNEWISQIQAKESTDIPEEIFEKIVQEIKKEKMKEPVNISYHKMREILKKLQQNKYYEHIYYIIYRLNGTSPPNFSPELEEKLRNMFKEIQGPFLKHCPKNRKNFLSYSYVLFKFCQLLEKDEFLKHFSLLKSREKLHVQDQIWKKICEEVNWEFIQSI
jgi:uncharacterized Zn finger protein (UPF0148 family)